MRYTGKCFQGKFLFSPPSTLPPPIPSHLLKARVSITRFAFYTLQYLKTLWAFGFYFTVCACSFYLCCLLLGVPETTILSVFFTRVLGECCASLCREDVLVRGVSACDANRSDSLMLVSAPSAVWPLLFLAVVTMSFYEKYPGLQLWPGFSGLTH